MPTCNACPTCHRPMPQPRVERLTPLLADALQQIAKQTQDGRVYVKVPAYQFRAQHAKLALWGLAEELLMSKRSGSGQTRSGSWRPTLKGMQFLGGITKVPSELHVQAGKVVGLGRTMVSFEEAMAGAASPVKARRAIDDEGERLFLREQARLERSYLEAE